MATDKLGQPMFFKRLRWRLAKRHVESAERWERATAAAEAIGMDEQAVKNGQRAIAAYLRALRWWPIGTARMLPRPTDVGSRDMDDALYGTGEGTMPCVICGTPIPRPAASHEPGEGVYCPACAAL